MIQGIRNEGFYQVAYLVACIYQGLGIYILISWSTELEVSTVNGRTSEILNFKVALVAVSETVAQLLCLMLWITSLVTTV